MDHRKPMLELLTTGGVGLVLLGEILRDIQGVKDALAKLDIRFDEGVHEGLSMQGQIKGMNRVIDRLFEIAEGTE